MNIKEAYMELLKGKRLKCVDFRAPHYIEFDGQEMMIHYTTCNPYKHNFSKGSTYQEIVIKKKVALYQVIYKRAKALNYSISTSLYRSEEHWRSGTSAYNEFIKLVPVAEIEE